MSEATGTATLGLGKIGGEVKGIGGSKGDEDCSKEYDPIVNLQKVETKTGEEDEEVVFKIRAKLFRFSTELKEWKERGTGDVRVLKHKETKKIRLLMRREKTLKICLNHYVNPSIELKENVGSDRSWVWQAVDYADGERDEAMLAIRFRDSKNAELFRDQYNSARKFMKELKEGKTESTEEPAVEDNKAVQKEEEEQKEEEKEQKAE